MTTDLTPGLWYHTWYSYPQGRVVTVADPHKIAGYLPHGSGIDGNWEIEVFKNGNIRVSSAYHAMDEYGGYDGWIPFSFRLMRAKTTRTNKLIGPCEGQVQVLHEKGDLIGRFYCPNSGKHYGLGDYLFDVIDEGLRQAGIDVKWWY